MAGRWFRPGDGPTPAAPEGGRAGPPPQYSPDGRWFWNGERWIPSAAVLAGEPEPEPDPVPVPAAAPAPAAPGRPRTLSLVAIGAGALIAVLLVTTIGVSIAGRGGNGPGVSTPPARQIFEAPFASGLRNAHVAISTRDGNYQERGQGVMTFTPSRGMRVTVAVGGQPIKESIDLYGISYERQTGDQTQWKVSDIPSTDFDDTGWADRDPPEQLRVTGQEQVGNDSAWHLTAKGGYNWWIRVKDGYPLKLVRQLGSITVTYLFDRFNSGGSIQVPTDNEVSTKLARGKVGDVLRVPWAQAQVMQVNPNYSARYQPDPGFRYVAAYLVFTNVTGATVKFDDLLNLTDTTGFAYANHTYLAPSPQLGATQMAPGQTIQGWMAFEVPQAAHGLTVRIPTPIEQNDADYLFSIFLSS